MVVGLTSQPSELFDNGFVDGVHDHLFGDLNGTTGVDLIAVDIQRGRDHGLPGPSK